MKISWLGQGGLFFEGRNCSLMIDPYLSNSLFEKKGAAFTRLVPVEESYLAARPDVLILTHAHADHTDEPTLSALLQGPEKIDVLSPGSVYYDMRKTYGDLHNLVLFDRCTEWSKKGVRIKAVRAVHSDPAPIGAAFEMDGLTIYVAGDTLYDNRIFEDIDRPVDILFVPINGTGNNMNCEDAVRFTLELKPRLAVPVHWGLFGKFTADPDLFLEPLMRQKTVKARKLDMYRRVDTADLFQRKMPRTRGYT